MSRPIVRFSLLSAVMFVAVRLVIGWHFYAEGVAKFQPGSNWSAAGFLRASVGPLAPVFQSYLPDDHGWEETMGGGSVGGESAEGEEASSDGGPLAAWRDRITDDWGRNAAEIYKHYDFTETQRETAAAFIETAGEDLDAYFAASSENDGASDLIDDYLHERARLSGWRERPEEGVAYEKERVAQKAAELRQWKAEIIAGVEQIGADLETRIAKLADVEQAAAGAYAPRTALTVLDAVMKWVVLVIGVCCFVGAFTRVAMTVGGLFLLSVVASQPPWVAGVVPDYKTIVEMVVMFALATTNVGKWGGLDYFLQFLFRGARSDAPGAG